MKFTLRQLEIFIAVAKAQNITLAAKQLCMSQSAASTALIHMESQFDITLFDRSGKTLQLNKTGQSLLTKGQVLMDCALDFQHHLEDNQEAGHLDIGASLTIGNYLGVKYFSQYVTEHPQAKANFQIANSPEILRKVLNFDIDIGLVESEIQHKDLQLIPWREDQLMVFCSPKHPLAQKGKLSRQDILNAKWILREADSGTRQTFDRAMQGLLSELNIFLELSHNEAIKRAVEAGIGIGCLSGTALALNFKNGDLVPLELPKRTMNRTFYFALNRSRQPSKAVQEWMKLCLNEPL